MSPSRRQGEVSDACRKNELFRPAASTSKDWQTAQAWIWGGMKRLEGGGGGVASHWATSVLPALTCQNQPLTSESCIKKQNKTNKQTNKNIHTWIRNQTSAKINPGMMGDDHCAFFVWKRGTYCGGFFSSLPPADSEGGQTLVFLWTLADRSAGKSGSLARERPRSHACH